MRPDAAVALEVYTRGHTARASGESVGNRAARIFSPGTERFSFEIKERGRRRRGAPAPYTYSVRSIAADHHNHGLTRAGGVGRDATMVDPASVPGGSGTPATPLLPAESRLLRRLSRGDSSNVAPDCALSLPNIKRLAHQGNPLGLPTVSRHSTVSLPPSSNTAD